MIVAGALLLVLGAGLVLLARWFMAHRPRIESWVVLSGHRCLRIRPMRWLKARHPRTWRFVAARFAPGEYLGLHLTIGLAICLAALWLFAGITEDIVHHDTITAFDVSLLDWLQAHTSSGGLRVARAISAVGSPASLAVVGLGVAIFLAARKEGLLLEGWVLAILGGELLNQALKRAIQRPRPSHSSILSYQSWSFPSGHAMESLVVFGMLTYALLILVPGARAHRARIILGAATLILAIGFTRLYLGVHYFSDVVGGYAAGALWLSACISGLEITRRWYARAR
jgi:undecaprenyl-diphosphatase